MKINRVLLTITIILHSITHTSQQKTILTWGMSARANGLHSGTQFYQKDTFSHAVINGHHFFGICDGDTDTKNDNRVCDLLKKQDLQGNFEQAKGDIEKFMTKTIRKIEKQTCGDPENDEFNVPTIIAAYITLTHKNHMKQRIHLAHIGTSQGSRALSFGTNGMQYYRTKDDVNGVHYAPLFICRDKKNSPILNNFLVIATKGLWDIMTNEQVIAFVNEKMNTPLEELKKQHTHNPKTIKRYENGAIMNTLLMLINQPIEEFYNRVSEREFYRDYKGTSWETIAQECDIAIDDIRKTLNMTPEQFDTTYPYNGINRTPLHDDFVEEDCGSSVIHDQKCMLIARALRDKANSDGNISVTVIDLSHPYSLQETIHGWWYFKKRSFCISLIAAIIGILYCKYA